MVCWWLSEPSQLKAKAGSIWKISILLFLVDPAFSIQMLIVQRQWWEEWAADEEIHLCPAQFEKEKTASPVLIMEYPLPSLAKAKLECDRSHRRYGKNLPGELILPGALVSPKCILKLPGFGRSSSLAHSSSVTRFCGSGFHS